MPLVVSTNFLRKKHDRFVDFNAFEKMPVVRASVCHPFSRQDLRHASENGVFISGKEGLSFTMRVQVQLCLPGGLARGRHNPEVPGSIPGPPTS